MCFFVDVIDIHDRDHQARLIPSIDISRPGLLLELRFRVGRESRRRRPKAGLEAVGDDVIRQGGLELHTSGRLARGRGEKL